MDPATIVGVALGYVGSLIAKKLLAKTDELIGDAVEKAYDRIVAFLKERLGRDPKPEDYSSNVLKEFLSAEDKEALQQAEEIFALSPVLRRAEMVAPVLQGAKVLWVDDNPDNNVYERMTLNSLGVTTDIALSTTEALSMLSGGKYDVIISDMARQGISGEGLTLLNNLKIRGGHPELIFYVGHLDSEKGTPQGAFGITNRPDDLLHYVLDALERERVV